MPSEQEGSVDRCLDSLWPCPSVLLKPAPQHESLGRGLDVGTWPWGSTHSYNYGFSLTFRFLASLDKLRRPGNTRPIFLHSFICGPGAIPRAGNTEVNRAVQVPALEKNFFKGLQSAGAGPFVGKSTLVLCSLHHSLDHSSHCDLAWPRPADQKGRKRKQIC